MILIGISGCPHAGKAYVGKIVRNTLREMGVTSMSSMSIRSLVLEDAANEIGRIMHDMSDAEIRMQIINEPFLFEPLLEGSMSDFASRFAIDKRDSEPYYWEKHLDEVARLYKDKFDVCVNDSVRNNEEILIANKYPDIHYIHIQVQKDGNNNGQSRVNMPARFTLYNDFCPETSLGGESITLSVSHAIKSLNIHALINKYKGV